MKGHNQAFLFWLPGLVVMTLCGWLLFGALPGMRMTGDLIAWLMELPVTTCYAVAAGGATLLTMHITGLDLSPEMRSALQALALQGNPHAKWALTKEALAWFGFLALYAVFFFPHY